MGNAGMTLKEKGERSAEMGQSLNQGLNFYRIRGGPEAILEFCEGYVSPSHRIELDLKDWSIISVKND